MRRKRADALQLMVGFIEREFARFYVARKLGNCNYLIQLGAVERDKLHIRIAALTSGEDTIAQDKEIAGADAIACRNALHDFFYTRYFGAILKHDMSGLACYIKRAFFHDGSIDRRVGKVTNLT